MSQNGSGTIQGASLGLRVLEGALGVFSGVFRWLTAISEDVRNIYGVLAGVMDVSGLCLFCWFN